ncbi:hypothetical protein SAMN06298216_3799 [Spirosomataceae bacterium TFI 002]|nr:hypothetical protein SAMN06298216_3799 [Spirosomataceae bacterium TFI 002]
MNKHFKHYLILFFCISYCFAVGQTKLLIKLDSPIIFKGNDTTAYRDPAILYHENVYYLFFTLVKTEEGKIYSYTAQSQSSDLKNWSTPKILTPKDQTLDYSSPGNVIKFNDEWILCLQTYPRPNHTVEQEVRYGSKDARLFIMRSKDLNNWGKPELIKVKGADIDVTDMGRMIDPYLLEDKDEKGKFWCFYKQKGVSMSYSYDMKNWTFHGNTKSGENVSVLNEKGEYILIHSPHNGIAIKRSADLQNWNDWGNIITLGQSEWDWAKGRISAGTVLKSKEEKKYIMFFHGSGPKTETEGDFDKNASIGIAWSDDLLKWDWPK